MTGFFLAHPDVNPLACFLSSPGARGSPEAILTDPRGRNAQTAPQARTVGPRRMSAVTAMEESAEGKPHQSRPAPRCAHPGTPRALTRCGRGRLRLSAIARNAVGKSKVTLPSALF